MEVHCGFNETSKITDKVEHLGSSLGFSYDVFILVYLAVPIVNMSRSCVGMGPGQGYSLFCKDLIGKNSNL